MDKIKQTLFRKIKNNIRDFERILNFDGFQFAQYDKGLSIYYDNHQGEFHKLFFSESDENSYIVLNDKNEKIEIDKNEERLVNMIIESIEQYSPVNKRLKDASPIGYNIYPDIDIYRNNGDIFINADSSLAIFNNDKLIYFEGQADEEKFINAFSTFQKIENKEEEVFTGARLLMREDIFRKRIENSKSYKEECKENKKIKIKPYVYIFLLIVINALMVFSVAKKHLYSGLLCLTILNLLYIKGKNISFSNELSLKPKYHIKRNDSLEVPGYIDVPLNMNLVTRFNLLYNWKGKG